MRNRPSLGGLIVGLLLTACLAGGVYFTLRFNIGGIRYLPPQASISISFESSPVSPFRVHRNTKDIGADTSRRVRNRELERRPTRQQYPHSIMAPEKPGSGSSPLSPGLSAEATNSQAPDRKTLKPIGYVQKAEGKVEAIVCEGDGVQVVHVGDAFEEKYTVAHISPEAVEIVASSASPNVLPSASATASNSTSGIQPGTEASASSGKPLPSNAALPSMKRMADSKGRPRLGEKLRIRTDESERQASVLQADSRQEALAAASLSLPKPIGFVEMQAGNRITVVPDGDSVRLVQPELALAGRRGIENGSKSVETASAPELTAPKQAVNNLNRSKTQPVLPVHNSTPIQASRTTPEKIVSSQHTHPGIPFKNQGPYDRPLAASRPIGFVEIADGRIQAIVDGGEGIHFVQVDGSVPETLIADGDFSMAAEGAPTSNLPPTLPPDHLAGARVNKGPPSGLRPEGQASFRPGPAEIADALSGKHPALGGSPEPWEPPDRPGPLPQAPVADDEAVPDRSPPDDVMAAWMGLEAEVASSSKRDEAVLGSLGYLSTQESRASPSMASSEPAVQPRGSPASDPTVLRSFGFGDWQHGRASPLASSLEGAARAIGSAQQNSIALKPIGYLDWQDGRALAVVDDGDDGVRLIHEGELLDDNRFRVVKVFLEAVEIAELPITRPGLQGDPTFQPYARRGVSAKISLPGPRKTPPRPVAAARLENRKDQSLQLNPRVANVPIESSLDALGFSLRGQGESCYDFQSLLTVPIASPGQWSTSGLNLYFPHGSNPAFPKVKSAICADATANSI